MKRKAKEVNKMKIKSVMKGRIRDGAEWVPFKIIWLIKSDNYELEAENLTTAPPPTPFLTFQEALEYLVENYSSWSD
jgi:hypothetical protein